jgi:hypothetical protein
LIQPTAPAVHALVQRGVDDPPKRETKMFNSTLTYTRIAMLVATALCFTAPAALAGYVIGKQTFIHTVVDMLAPSGSSIVRESETSITIQTHTYVNAADNHTITFTVDTAAAAPTQEQRERLGIKGDEHCSVDVTLDDGGLWVANDTKTKSRVKRYEFDGFFNVSVAQCTHGDFCSINVAAGAICYIGTGRCDTLFLLNSHALKVLSYIQSNYCSGLAISRPY